MEGERAWPRQSDSEAGAREHEISELLASVGAEVVQTGEARKIAHLDSEDFKALPEKLTAALQVLADRANVYLAGPTIRDRFTDHDKRRAWRTEAAHRYGPEAAAYLRSNRLSLNNIAMLALSARSVTTQFSKVSVELSRHADKVRGCVEKISDLFKDNGFSMRYGQATNEEKLEIVRLLKCAPPRLSR